MRCRGAGQCSPTGHVYRYCAREQGAWSCRPKRTEHCWSRSRSTQSMLSRLAARCLGNTTRPRSSTALTWTCYPASAPKAGLIQHCSTVGESPPHWPSKAGTGRSTMSESSPRIPIPEQPLSAQAASSDDDSVAGGAVWYSVFSAPRRTFSAVYRAGKRQLGLDKPQASAGLGVGPPSRPARVNLPPAQPHPAPLHVPTWSFLPGPPNHPNFLPVG